MKYELEMRLTIKPARDPNAPGMWSGDRLELVDTLELGDKTLREMAALMARLDEVIRGQAVAPEVPAP